MFRKWGLGFRAEGQAKPSPGTTSLGSRWQQLDRDLPADHLARRIARLVDTLDLRALEATCGGRGSAAWPPALLLKLILYEVYTGGARPARSCLYAFRDRLGPRLDELNRQLLTQAQAAGPTWPVTGPRSSSG
jgi:hypothetical protein